MRVSNFINFSVVAGFFLGLAIGIMKFDEPEYMLFMTIIVTISMYLISLSIAAIYTFLIEPNRSILSNKEAIEKQLEYFDGEFDDTERKVRSLQHFIENFDLLESQDSTQKAL